MKLMEFQALAVRTRLSPRGKRLARAVLVSGLSVCEAANDEGVERAIVRQAVGSIRRLQKLDAVKPADCVNVAGPMAKVSLAVRLRGVKLVIRRQAEALCPEQRLWREVIVAAVEDLAQGSAWNVRSARTFFESHWFDVVAGFCGLESAFVLRVLREASLWDAEVTSRGGV